MAPKGAAGDPRMKQVISALQTVSNMEGQAANILTRGKVAVSESGALSGKGFKAAIAMIKAAEPANKAVKKLLTAYKELKNTGEFGKFGATMKTEAAALSKMASLAKQYTTALSDTTDRNALKTASISYEGLFQYANQYVTYFISFSKDYNQIVKFKGGIETDDKSPALAKIQDYLTISASIEGMCNNFQTRGKTALKELKAAKKSEKDKSVIADIGQTTKHVEALMNGAKNAVSEYAGMLKDYAAAKKDGAFDQCAIKLKSRGAAFRAVEQFAADYAKGLESARFEHKDLKRFPSLQGLSNYKKSFDSYYKSIKGTL